MQKLQICSIYMLSSLLIKQHKATKLLFSNSTNYTISKLWKSLASGRNRNQFIDDSYSSPCLLLILSRLILTSQMKTSTLPIMDHPAIDPEVLVTEEDTFLAGLYPAWGLWIKG